jgi:hypothetical protein
VALYKANNLKTQKNYDSIISEAQNPTLHGLNVYVSNYSALPTQSLNSLIQIMTSVFQQNAQQFLQSSALSALAGKTSNQSQDQITYILQQVNAQVFTLINDLIDLSATSLTVGLDVMEISSSTINI